MSVYYFVRAAVVINYVNKKNNNSRQARSEQNKAEHLYWFIITYFWLLLLLPGWKGWGKTKYYRDRNSWMWLASCWRRACWFSAEVDVKMQFLLASPVHPPVYSGHYSELWPVSTLNAKTNPKWGEEPQQSIDFSLLPFWIWLSDLNMHFGVGFWWAFLLFVFALDADVFLEDSQPFLIRNLQSVHFVLISVRDNLIAFFTESRESSFHYNQQDPFFCIRWAVVS